MKNRSMSIIKFLTSKTFLKQLVLAVFALVVLCFIMLKWLNVTTNHGDFETVPELKGKSISVAELELKDNNLVMKIQDSANYNPDYPKFSVIEQEPPAGEKVKEDRKIYITLNPSGYRKITYVDNIGKGMVLKLTHKRKALKAGDKLARTSVIDLVLGNGKRP